MARRLFVLPSVGAGDQVLIASNTGGTPAEIVPNGSGGPVVGSVLQAASDGSLPRVLGPDDGTSTLYLLHLNYRGAVTGSPVTLTGVDQGAASPGGGATSADIAAAVAALVNSAPSTLDTLGELAAALQGDEGTAAALATTVGGKATAFSVSAIKTGAYTAAANEIVPVDTTSAAVTITLPAAPADKTRVVVKHIVQGSSNAVTVAAGGSDHFNTATGPTSFAMPLLNQAVQLQYVAATHVWLVISTDVPLSQLDTRYALSGTSEQVVNHGSTAGTARPSGAAQVYWTGTVTPTNAALGDVWQDRSVTPYVERVYNGSAFTALGGADATSLLTVVSHGSTASTARPTGVGVVLWVGSVIPTNAVAGDRWDDTSTSPPGIKRLSGSLWVLMGANAAAGATPLDGQQLLVFGHSYSQGLNASNSWGWVQRLNAKFSFKSIGNRSVSGASSYKEANIEIATDISYIQAQTIAVFSDAVINDVADAENATYGGNAATPPTRALNKFKNSKSFLFALVRRTGAGILDTAGAYTGTWTANTGDAASISFSNAAASTSHSTTTQNDSVTFTGLTAGAKVAVILQGVDNSTNGTSGAAYSITATGMTAVTGTTGDQFYRARDTPATRGPMPVLVQLPAGVTSLTITKTDATGTILYVNALLYQLAAGAANWIVLMKAPYVVTGASNANVDTYNAALDAVVAAHGGGADFLVADPNANGWDKTTMCSTTDGLHPNDKGHAFLLGLMQSVCASGTFGNQRNKV